MRLSLLVESGSHVCFGRAPAHAHAPGGGGAVGGGGGANGAGAATLRWARRGRGSGWGGRRWRVPPQPQCGPGCVCVGRLRLPGTREHGVWSVCCDVAQCCHGTRPPRRPARYVHPACTPQVNVRGPVLPRSPPQVSPPHHATPHQHNCTPHRARLAARVVPHPQPARAGPPARHPQHDL